MKRMMILFGQRRMMVLVTLTILVLAAAALAASSASFTATSANPGNMFTAGTLSMSNSDAAAIWTISDLKPGDTDVVLGSVTIGNTGSVAGLFSMSASGLADTPGANGGDLSDVLVVTVRDGATTVYSGSLAGLVTASPIGLGTWAAGASHTYDFLVSWPDGGVPGSATTGDNAYQGSACSIDLTWNASSD